MRGLHRAWRTLFPDPVTATAALLEEVQVVADARGVKGNCFRHNRITARSRIRLLDRLALSRLLLGFSNLLTTAATTDSLSALGKRPRQFSKLFATSIINRDQFDGRRFYIQRGRSDSAGRFRAVSKQVCL